MEAPVRLKILVIDDEEGFRFFLRKGLSRRGHEVREADGGADGIEIARKDPPDVVFTDLKMPDVDGLRVLEEIRSFAPETIVILMTAYATIPTAIAAVRAGAAEFLTKPFELEQAVTVLDKALEQHRLVVENRQLRQLLDERTSFRGLIGGSSAMRELYRTIELVGRSDGTVLISGESGSGKELVARAIHTTSDRREGPLVPVHCAAIPEALLEGELFGSLPGAYTGATHRKHGAFERAHGGTIFLDEVSEIPLSVQVKLLRVIQENEVQPLGAEDPVAVDLRWVAATNRDLEPLVEAGEFREDLYFRLNVLPVYVPPLRDRRGDLPLLVDHCLGRFAKREGDAPPRSFTPAAMAALEAYPWPGNVRELENIVERVMTLNDRAVIDRDALPPEIRELATAGGFPDFATAKAAFERRYMMDVLQEARGVITRAATLAGMSRQSLHTKIRQFEIDAERFRR